MQLMLNKVRRKLEKQLFPMGFCKTGNCYYYIKNDMAFCLSFDQPSGLLYCTFHIIPLYIPSEMRYYTYGNRLNCFPNSSVEVLMKSASNQEIDTWVEGLLSALERIVFPFFDRISSPLRLLHFANSDPTTVNQFFHSPPDQLQRLRVFTYLYLDDYENLMYAIKQAYSDISCANYMDAVKSERKRELLRIESCLSDSSFNSSRYCAEIVTRSLQCCFGQKMK